MSDLTELFDLTNRLMTPAGERPTHKDSEVWMFIKAGLRRVTALLRARNVVEMRGTVESTVLAGDAYIIASGLGDYGFITKPLRVWERPTTDTNGWVLMQYAHPLPMNLESGEYFRYRDYMRYDRSQVRVLFPVACTRNMVIRVEGPCRLFIENASINQTLFADILREPAAFFAAGLAAQARGDMELAQTLERQAMEFVDGLVQEDVHLRQNRPVRLRRARPGFSTWRRW
jgi:hypothetical protein